jgi:hypothetical protein
MAGELLESMSTDGTFNKALYQRVALSFYRTIEASYVHDRSRPTQAETKRRFEMLEQTFRMLRHDYQWGVDRILAVLPKALRCKLDGVSWDPGAESRIWTPN